MGGIERLAQDRRDLIAEGRLLGAALWALTLLFLFRVVGHGLAVAFGVGWLPAAEHWESGLVPYPALLAAQVAGLIAITFVDVQVWCGAGWFVAPRPSLARWMRRLSYLYAGSMIVRYAVTMALIPEWRWFGDTIPIVFHCLLAAWLFAYARVLAGAGSSNVSRSSGRRKTSRQSDWYTA